MTALHRKLLRDMLHLRGQVAAVALVVACGVAMFVSLRSMHAYLISTLTDYYQAQHFADIFASFREAPVAAVTRDARRIPGVAEARARIVVDVVLDVPGLAEPATARLVSVPEIHAPMLNDLYLRRGRWVAPHRRGEVLASEAFADANALDVGDTLGAIVNGRWQTLTIVGIALSPEFVYAIRGAGDIFPDNRHFGILWMGDESLAGAFDMAHAANDLVLSLAPGADQDAVIAALDRILERYGGTGAYGRDDQPSYRFLADEIRETEVSSVVTPAIFLLVTAFMLHLLMTRLVGTQRDLIGTLKAFGYGNGMVARHYLAMAAVPVAAGSALGLGLGLVLAGRFARMYAQFFQFPVLRFTPTAGPFLIGLAAAGGAALVGAWSAARRASALPPADAMRPEAPPAYRAGPLERLGLTPRLSPEHRIIARNIERRPARALAGIAGIALSVGVVVVGLYAYDAIDWLARVQFRTAQREDVTVVLNQPRDISVRHDFMHLAGVMRVEPFRAVPVRLRAGARSHRTVIQGWAPGGVLRRIVDRRLREFTLPDHGLLLTTALARQLGVSRGSEITVEVLEGQRVTRTAYVVGVVDELVGMSGYMDLSSLNRLAGEGAAVSGVFLSVDPAHAAALYAGLKRLPAVSGVGVRTATMRSFDETIRQSFRISLTLIVGFACVIAFGMVYNTARIALSERGRELGSLRVLGFARHAVARMLLGEQLVLTVLAMPPGLAIGWALSLLVTRRGSDTLRLPMIVNPATYLTAMGVVVAAGLVSALLVRRRVVRLDMVAVLKTRE